MMTLLANSWHNHQTTTSVSEVSFTLSNKDEPQVIYENGIFNFNQKNQSTKYWLCVERECGVYTYTSLTGQFTRINGTHTHSLNPDQVAVKILRDKMKARILAVYFLIN
ncbi:unnamed protein product [Adineta steineri]|uniref:FLYWCH-type domain-containing protein n=1 Tax=Adineta steineri TaxID=433720 RepID=A0A819Z187_9BILA|nr:unnamed protein product [Adineta steineri]CAF4162851.1 unnamed protein product [Adineta steineri]